LQLHRVVDHSRSNHTELESFSMKLVILFLASISATVSRALPFPGMLASGGRGWWQCKRSAGPV
jgi:hypothetical protein